MLNDNYENLEYNRLTRMLSNSGMPTVDMAGDFSNRGIEGEPEEDGNSLFSFNFLNDDSNNNATLP